MPYSFWATSAFSVSDSNLSEMARRFFSRSEIFTDSCKIFSYPFFAVSKFFVSASRSGFSLPEIFSATSFSAFAKFFTASSRADFSLFSAWKFFSAIVQASPNSSLRAAKFFKSVSIFSGLSAYSAGTEFCFSATMPRKFSVALDFSSETFLARSIFSAFSFMNFSPTFKFCRHCSNFSASSFARLNKIFASGKGRTSARFFISFSCDLIFSERVIKFFSAPDFFSSAARRIFSHSEISSSVGIISSLTAIFGWEVEPQTGQGLPSSRVAASFAAIPAFCRKFFCSRFFFAVSQFLFAASKNFCAASKSACNFFSTFNLFSRFSDCSNFFSASLSFAPASRKLSSSRLRNSNFSSPFCRVSSSFLSSARRKFSSSSDFFNAARFCRSSSKDFFIFAVSSILPSNSRRVGSSALRLSYSIFAALNFFSTFADSVFASDKFFRHLSKFSKCPFKIFPSVKA